MSVMLSPYGDDGTVRAWRAALESALAEHAPQTTLEVHPEITDPAAVEFLVAWRHDPADLVNYPGLRAIISMGAGVEQFLGPEWPELPVVRLADPVMADEMAAYALYWALRFQRRFDVIEAQQRDAHWSVPVHVAAPDHAVGILGWGVIGRRIGEAFHQLGYPVHAWSRSGTDDDWATSWRGPDGLSGFLGACRTIVNVLPSSDATADLMNDETLAQCADGSVFINIGRGSTVDEAALVRALDQGPLAAVVLDVTVEEPLPTTSPLWSHPKVHITPHIAGATHKRTAAVKMAENIGRILRGEEPFPVVDRTRGY